MNHDFSFRRDFKYIVWRSTLQVHVVRTLAAAIMWTILSRFGQDSPPALAFLVTVPVMLLAGVPYCLLVLGIAQAIPVAALAILPLFIIVAGDPIVFALHKANPKIVPVEKFGFVNFRFLIFVVDTERMAADNNVGSGTNAPREREDALVR